MRKVFRYLLKVLGFLGLLILLYALAALVGSLIPVNRHQDKAEGDIEIFLRTNGVHTSYIFPAENEVFDWNEIIDPNHTLSKRTTFSFISFGWGDLEFYEKTPQWSDLTFPVAFRALFLSSPSALHVELHDLVILNERVVSVKISEKQYERLVDHVLGSFQMDPRKNLEPVRGLHYNQADVFYLSNKSFSIFHTCNTWVNAGLKKAEMKACLWTPVDKGVFYQYR